ncbi:MAG TPA: AsmA family protein [Pseudomonadales bacterium]
MLNFLLRLLMGLAVLVLLAIGAAYFLLQDANRFKPEIQQLIAEQTGARVEIGGDLSWALFPPLSLAAADITADYEGGRYVLADLGLKLDLMSVIRSRDINQWEVVALTLKDLSVDQEGSLTTVEFFELRNFKPATPSPFEARLRQRSAEGDELPLEANGLIALHLDTRKASLTDTRFETTDASGVCNLEAAFKEGTQPPDPEEAIVPVSVFRSIDWTGQCVLDRLTLEEENFKDVTVDLANTGGRSTTDVVIPDFFNGSARTTVNIDASSDPVRWRIRPDLSRADSTEVMAWLDQRLKWVAPLAYSGEITMTGNTTEELVRSVKGKTTFDGGQGRIDITQIKQPLLALATLFQEPQRIAAWPDLWDYQRLGGDWVINGTRHQMDFALDNLTAKANGDYDPLTDALDMNVQFLFESNPEVPGFDVNPALLDLPIPLTCTGTLADPKCGVTREATTRLVASVLRSQEGQKLIDKLDRKIDEEVPEQYRDTARGLLDMLGGSRKKAEQEN